MQRQKIDLKKVLESLTTVPNENSVRTVTVSFPRPTADFNYFEEVARL
jgi:hypothetical protein